MLLEQLVHALEEEFRVQQFQQTKQAVKVQYKQFGKREEQDTHKLEELRPNPETHDMQVVKDEQEEQFSGQIVQELD